VLGTLLAVPSSERIFDSGSRRAERALRDLGDEYRHARLRLGLSQREVSQAARIHRSTYSRIEAGKLRSLAVSVATQVAGVLGLNLSVRAFPGGPSIRDAGQARRLLTLVQSVGPPFTYRTDVPLPAAPDRMEQRAWDVVISGAGERTAIEFETRLYDIQAQTRRLRLKWRDDPVDHLLIVVADTKGNRRVLGNFGDLLADFPRLRTDAVLRGLRAGRHPPTGLVLLSTPLPRRSAA
jgi:transcriptional regulator with XRE-family HTH domain